MLPAKQCTAVVNYPNIGRNFLLSADHRVPHYPHPRPSKCDYRLQSSTHVITAPAASGGSASLVWLHLQHFHLCDHRVASIYTILALQLSGGMMITIGGEMGDNGWWNSWLQIVWLDWSVYDLITKEAWSQIIVHNQGYQNYFRWHMMMMIWWWE